MAVRFTVLASGSAGNAIVVQPGGCGVLFDAGLRRDILQQRLEKAGLAGLPLAGLVLTHTHGDHWNEGVLSWLARQGVPLFCHPSHQLVLGRAAGFREMQQAGLVRTYATGEEFAPGPGLRAWPIPVSHDGGATFAFRVEGPADLFGSAAVVGIATDLGIWEEELAVRLGSQVFAGLGGCLVV